jgi:glycerol-3-phosphate O-acyltransferase
MLSRIRHPLGDMICAEDEQAMLLTYYRNNILHLFVLPSLIACLMQRNGELHREQIVQLVKSIYPFMQSELFLPWAITEIEGIITQWLDALVHTGLLIPRNAEQMACPSPSSKAHTELSVLARGVRQNLERYYMTVSLLTQQGSGRISQKRLEDLCQMLAQRLSVLHEFGAPEFSDKALFRNFVETLIHTNVVKMDESGGMLNFDDRLVNIADGARHILSAEVRQSILQITRVTDAEIEAAMAEKEKKEKKKSAA